MNFNWARIAICISVYGICVTIFYLLLVSADAQPTTNGHPLPFILFVAPVLNRLRGPSENRSSLPTQLLGVFGMHLAALVPFVAGWLWPEKIMTVTDGILACSATCILVYTLDWAFDCFGRRVGNAKPAG